MAFAKTVVTHKLVGAANILAIGDAHDSWVGLNTTRCYEFGIRNAYWHLLAIVQKSTIMP